MALVKGTRVSDRLVGTTTYDFIFAYKGNDTILAGGGNDKVYADDGNDSIDGGAGNDTLYGDAGADTILGGDGDDFIDGSELSTTGQGSNLREIDRLFGGAGNDFIRLDQKDVALGGSGNDGFQVDSYYGPDTVWRLNFAGIGGATAVTFAQAGSYWGTTKVGQFERVSMSINNALAGSSIIGSSGDDFFSVNLAFASAGALGARVDGGAGNDRVFGTARNDNLIGGTGNDNLGGSGGNDTLLGNSGDDELSGGTGADRMTGGPGYDQFVFSTVDVSGAGLPVISDFNRVDDILIFYGGGSGVDFGTEINLLQKGATVTNATTAAGIGQFLYDTDSGRLSIDANGSTAGGVYTVLILQNLVSITAADIFLA